MLKGAESQARVKIGELKFRGQILTVWESTTALDLEWDNFLAAAGFEHFEQSSLWAEVKKLEGWIPYRVIVTKDNNIIAGFQILWKEKYRYLKIGLLMKGPIIAIPEPLATDLILNFLKRTARKKFWALLIQAPDNDDNISFALLKEGFAPNFLRWIIKSANIIINLDAPEDQILKQMKRQKRQNIQLAQRAGIIVRQGGQDKLETFFKLMCMTCQRRGVHPNPSNLKTLSRIWEVFYPEKKIALFLAEYQNKIISGLVTIRMGAHLSLWKFGWSGELPQFRPNDLLFWETFKWAKSTGCKKADLGAFGTYYLKNGKFYNGYENYLKKQDVRFKTGFGGEIIRLQPGLIYFSNYFLSILARTILPRFASFPLTEKFLYKLIGAI